MKKKDQDKHFNQKCTKTINFDKMVLMALEKRAKNESTTVSNIVNMLCRRFVMTDPEFYKIMAKEHYMMYQRFKYMIDETKLIYETNEQVRT